MENENVSLNKSEQVNATDEPITKDYDSNFDATKNNDEVEDVVVQQHHYVISPGSEVDVDVMVHVKEMFHNVVYPIFEKARAGHSQMLDELIYNKYVHIVRTYPMLPIDDKDPYTNFEIGHGVEGDNLY